MPDQVLGKIKSTPVPVFDAGAAQAQVLRDKRFMENNPNAGTSDKEYAKDRATFEKKYGNVYSDADYAGKQDVKDAQERQKRQKGK